MTKIRGFFEVFLDEELYKKLRCRSKAIRTYCLVKFKTKEGLTDPYPAIIDTGAHTSLLPLYVWKSVQYNLLGEHYVAGLVPGTKLDVKVGELSLVFADLLNTTREYTFLCFLSPSDRTPLILGFKESPKILKMIRKILTAAGLWCCCPDYAAGRLRWLPLNKSVLWSTC